MKHHSSALRSPAFRTQSRHAARGFALFCLGCASKVYIGFANFVTNLQIGRMESFLRTMSDEDLAQIGITRSEIKRHARYLITYEYDGL